MPFESTAQRGFMYANHPAIARRWQAETPAHAHLPHHVAKMSAGGAVCARCGYALGGDVKPTLSDALQKTNELHTDENDLRRDRFADALIRRS